MPAPAIMKNTDALRNAALDAITTLIDAGAGVGTIKIYDGTMPADADDAIVAQVLLATLTFTDPAAPGASAGLLTFSAIASDTSAAATGVAAWARIEDSNGNNVFDVDVGTTGSGASLELNMVNIVMGGTVAISAFTVAAAPASPA